MNQDKLRANGTNTFEWKYKPLVLDKNMVEHEFILLANRRDLKHSQVLKLRRLLESGGHFDTPIVCNLKNNKYRLIDGNHRREAIIAFLEANPGRNVRVGVCYYENLSEEEEKQKFTAWNSSLKQSMNDYIQQYWNDMPLTKWMSQDFPCRMSHSWGKNTFEFKQLLYPYLSRNTSIPTFRGDAMSFIEAVKNLTKEDYKILKAFMNEYINIFGNPDRKNLHYRQTPFIATAREWFINYSRQTPEKMKNKMRRLLGSSVITSWSTMGASQQNLLIAIREILSVMNGATRNTEEMLYDPIINAAPLITTTT